MFNPQPKPEKTPKKPKKKIRSLSIKRERQNALYLKKRKAYLTEHPLCELKYDGCFGRATDIHHTRGRLGELLTDEQYFCSACRYCHHLEHTT